MLPDDPRHGTTRGFHAGCRDSCCRAARARYEKESRLARLSGGRSVPAIGAQRRIRGLMRLGWTSEDIAKTAGWANRNYVLRIVNGQKGKPTTWLERKTDRAIREVYDNLSMKLPEMNPYRTRGRAHAERMGWPSPLAWDDENIDDPTATPAMRKQGEANVTRDSIEKNFVTEMDIDPVVVQRILDGDITLRPNRAERLEVIARWIRGDAELERLTGWNVARYRREQGAA